MSISPALKSLERCIFLLMSPLLGGLVLPLIIDEVPVRFPWFSALWWTHWPLPLLCSLHHQYYFPSLVLFSTPISGSPSIQGGRSLVYAGSPLFDFMLDVLDSQMISWSHMVSFGPLIIELGTDHPWNSCWTTFLRWGGCYNYSGPWPSPALL